MAENTVQAVRQAELQAAQLMKDTENRKLELLEKTQRDIKDKEASNRLQEQKKTVDALEKVQKENEELMEHTVKTAEQEIIALKNETLMHQKEAIKMMVAELI